MNVFSRKRRTPAEPNTRTKHKAGVLSTLTLLASSLALSVAGAATPQSDVNLDVDITVITTDSGNTITNNY